MSSEFAIRCFALVAICVVACTDASAFRLIDATMSEKFAESDVVLVGRAISLPHKVLVRDRGSHAVDFVTEVAMKGTATPKFKLLISGGFHEMAIQCCAPGQLYLLYLRRVDEGLFVSVRGHFGVYRLSEHLQD